VRLLYTACLVVGLSTPVFAQTATPEATALAKQLVAKIEPNPQ
jgi:hypothetical protein